MNPRHPQSAQSRQQLPGGIGGRRCRWKRAQLEVELGSTPEKPFQRPKHLEGPATKARSPFDQRSVETSIASFVIRMLFTDPGLPPRARLEIVPAVEMTVPFFVCSM